MTIPFGPYDLALVAAVSAQATALATVREARWKAAILSLPIPFTMATLAVGKPVGAAHVLGLPMLFCYAQGVRILHVEWRVPIVAAIALSAGGYVALGALLASVVPATGVAFWTSAVATFVAGLWLLRRMPARHEPGYRSPLPLWIKVPVIVLVILLLVALKNTLQGFMTLFPMMGVVGAYEARHSLRTICRQMPVLMIALAPMMVACRLIQPYVALPVALALGWVVFLGVFLPFTRSDWAAQPGSAPSGVGVAEGAST